MTPIRAVRNEFGRATPSSASGRKRASASRVGGTLTPDSCASFGDSGIVSPPDLLPAIPDDDADRDLECSDSDTPSSPIVDCIPPNAFTDTVSGVYPEPMMCASPFSDGSDSDCENFEFADSGGHAMCEEPSPPRRRRRLSPIECNGAIDEGMQCSTGSFGYSEVRLAASRSPLVVPGVADVGGFATPAVAKVVPRARVVAGSTPPPLSSSKSPSAPLGTRARIASAGRAMAPTPVVTAPKKRAAGTNASFRSVAGEASDDDGGDGYDGNATSGNTKGPWSQEEDDLLTQLVNHDGARNWRRIAMRLNGRYEPSGLGVCTRDAFVALAWVIPVLYRARVCFACHFRVAKQCRERWHHHLCPGISKAPWTKHEDDTIIELQATIGNKWAEMARMVRSCVCVCVFGFLRVCMRIG
jgi:hypothetical protein